MAFGGQKFLRPNPPPWLSPYLISRKIGTKRQVWATKNSVLPQNSVSLVLEPASISFVPYHIPTRNSVSPGAGTRDDHRCDARQGEHESRLEKVANGRFQRVHETCLSDLSTRWIWLLGRPVSS
jgi:hypothetical protein